MFHDSFHNSFRSTLLEEIRHGIIIEAGISIWENQTLEKGDVAHSWQEIK